MRKNELLKIWKQLDRACEALERLEEEDINTGRVDFSAVVSLKNEIEEMIEQKTRK